MELKNGYKVIYEQTADGKRTFYATKTATCDPTVDDMIVEATIGEYKLVYEKNGRVYGSKTGVPAEGDKYFTEFDKVFEADVEETEEEEPVETTEDEPTFDLPTYEEGEEE